MQQSIDSRCSRVMQERLGYNPPHLSRKAPSFPQEGAFPYNVPVIAQLEKVHFESSVTFLVGENGSGKSTFLEALATTVRLPTVGAEEAGRDPSLAEVRQLSKHLRLGWTQTHRTGILPAG